MGLSRPKKPGNRRWAREDRPAVSGFDSPSGGESLETYIVAVYRALFGEAPVAVELARTERTLTAVVDGPQTPLERRLIGSGEEELVRSERAAIHEFLSARLRGLAERALDLPVTHVAAVSEPASGRDILVFVLTDPGAMPTGAAGRRRRLTPPRAQAQARGPRSRSRGRSSDR